MKAREMIARLSELDPETVINITTQNWEYLTWTSWSIVDVTNTGLIVYSGILDRGSMPDEEEEA